MLFFKRSLYFWVSVGFFLNIAFLSKTVSSERHGCKKDRPRLQLGTWEKANEECSRTDFGDIKDIRNRRMKSCYLSYGLWFGLKKRAPTKIELCESANSNGGSFQNVSCARKLLSVCVKDNATCNNPFTKNGNQCFLPVYEKKTFFNALDNCIMNGSKLYTFNASQIPSFNATRIVKTSLFWAGKLYEVTINPYGKWTWLDGTKFKEWDEWRIEINDVGCRGCGFWKNGSIHLTSNCFQNMSYLCKKYQEEYIPSLLNAQQMSWEDANRTCGTGGLLQLSQRDDNPFDTLNITRTGDKIIQRNMSYWLGLYSQNCPEVRVKVNFSQEKQSVLQNKWKRCHYVQNSSIKPGDCLHKNGAICIKPAKIVLCKIMRSNKTFVELLTTEKISKIFPNRSRKMSRKTKKEIRRIIRQKDGDCYSYDSTKPKKRNLRDLLGSINKSFRCSTGPCNNTNQSSFENKEPLVECPLTWSLINNKSCWKAFSGVKMTWEAAHVFCLQQEGHLADSTDFQAIKGKFSNGTRHWIRGDTNGHEFRNASSYAWYWSNGTSFSSSESLWPLKEVGNTSGERCAYAYKENGTISWKDSSCDECRLFFCTPCETGECKKNRTRRNHQDMKEYTKRFQNKIRKCRDTRKHPNKAFSEIQDRLLELVDSCDFHGPFNSSISGTAVDARITTLERLNKFKDNTSSVPNRTIRKLCFEHPNCTVTRLKVVSRDLPVDISKISNLTPRVLSDVIILHYTVNGTKINKLQGGEFVSLNFSNKPKDPDIKSEHVICLFLDSQNEWNRTGMKVRLIERDTIECLTSHLSTFTMVLLSKEDQENLLLNIVTYIGSGMSLAGLLLTCVVYVVLYKDLQILTTSRHLVHLNLQIALGLTQITFLAGGSPTHNKVACKVVAILVHYFSFAAFVWILLEAIMLYLKLVAVYGGEFVRIKNFLLFGWGFPLLFVGLSASAKNEAYGTKDWCWLSYEEGFVWIVFAPVIIVAVVGLVTIIAVVRVLFTVSKSEDANAKKKIISAARGVAILFPTLGLSWGFSVIAVNHDHFLWKYLYAISTSLQGFLIFLIYGVCNTEIRVAVVRKLGFDVHLSSSTT